MDNASDPVEITCEFLQKHMERAAYCTSATLSGDDFREILKLATRRKTFAVLGLHHLLQMRDRDESDVIGARITLLIGAGEQSAP
jgi:hypothetical protein